uniref:DHHA1 domain-containing protein n=1 Tax=Svornostia abyssi TaxID=2898438 RepID=UPI00338FA07A
MAEIVAGIEPKQLMDVADRVKGKLGDQGAVVLGAAADGKVSLVVAVSPALVERGVKAGAIVKEAAQVVGGGGGGRDTIAQAGGKDAAKLPDALTAAKAAIERALQ